MKLMFAEGALLSWVVVGCIMLTSCSGGRALPTAEAGFIIFEGPTFHLRVPANWEQTSNQEFQALFLHQEEEGFRANLGISVEPTAEENTVEAIAQRARDFQSSDYPAYTVLSEESLAADERPAFKRFYTWYSDDFDLDVKQIQLFVKDREVLYILTATSLASDFDDYESTFSSMISSFTITG